MNGQIRTVGLVSLGENGKKKMKKIERQNLKMSLLVILGRLIQEKEEMETMNKETAEILQKPINELSEKELQQLAVQFADITEDHTLLCDCRDCRILIKVGNRLAIFYKIPIWRSYLFDIRRRQNELTLPHQANAWKGIL